MSEYKYRFEDFMLFDCVGLENHLKQMAKRGWQLESIGRLFWKYRKEEPADLSYSVTYTPNASVYDPEPTQEQQQLMDYCQAAGWKKVCDMAQLQIFVTEEIDPVPIETDETIRLEIIHRSMKKNFLWGHLVLVIVFSLNLILQSANFNKYPLTYLADSSWFQSVSLILWGLLLIVTDMLYYIYWVKKAKKRVTRGESLPEAKAYHIIARIGLFGVTLLALPLLFSGTIGQSGFMLLYCIGMILVFAAVWKMQKHLKEQGMPKAKNIALTLLVDFVLVFALMGSMIYFGVHTRIFSNDPQGYYAVNDSYQWPIWKQELPLTVEDLIPIEYEHYSYENNNDETMFLKVMHCRQNAPPDGESRPEMNYIVYTVKMDFLHDFILRKIEEDQLRYYTEEAKNLSGFIPIDDEQWKADEVYQFRFGTTMEDYWMICKDNRIILFRPYFELTDEMKPIIVEKLTA